MPEPIKRIRELIAKKLYLEAVQECNQHLVLIGSNNALMLRERAKAFSMLGDHKNSYRDRKLIIEQGSGELADYFLAGLDALHGELFVEAKDLLMKVLDLGNEQRSKWFESSTIFYLSYAAIKMQDTSAAKELIEKLRVAESEIAMPIPNVGIRDLNFLEELIRKK